MKIRYIVICIIVGITLSLVTACNLGARLFTKGGDDQPIVVVGGSLHVTAQDGEWKPVLGDLVHHDKTGNASKRYVVKIDIVYVKDQLPAIDKVHLDDKASIEMKYGPSQPSVFLEMGKGGMGVTIKGGGTVEQLHRNVVSFPTLAVPMTEVIIPGATQQHLCGDQGRCTLIIHYCDKPKLCR